MGAVAGRVSARSLAFAAWLVTVGFSVLASSLSAAHGRTPEVFLPAAITGVVYATAGAWIYLRRPDNATGLALIASALLPSLLVVLRYVFPWAVVLSIGFASQAALIPLSYVVLTFPSGNFSYEVDRRALFVLIGVGVLGGLAEVLTLEPTVFLPPASCEPCVDNPLAISNGQLYPMVSTINNVLLLVAALTVTYLLIRRWRHSRGLLRAALTPVVVGAAVLGVGYAVVTFVTPLVGLPPNVAAPLLLALRLSVPIGLAVVFLRFYSARGAVVRELVRIGPRSTIGQLEVAVRRATGDPDLTILRTSGLGGYVDGTGAAFTIAQVPAERRLIPVQRNGVTVAAVVLDPALEADAELVAVISETVGYAAESSGIHEELVARGGDVSRLPRGEVTFLFGDVERSTELLQRLEEAYAGVLAKLREIVRQSTDENAGFVVDMRADECFLAFASPSTAVAAARQIQAGIAATAWPDGAVLRLRIGLHCGRPELTTNGYVGLDVHHAARVMASALGGQIIASQAVAEALRRSPIGGPDLSPLGIFTLRGIPGEEALYEVPLV